jgi:hypothetical protein
MNDHWSRIPESVVLALPTIGSTALAVYAALGLYADATGVCWPSTNRLAEVTGLGRRAVQVALARLKAGGHIDHPDPRQPTVYRLVGCARTCAEAHVGAPPAHVGAPEAHVHAPTSARTCAWNKNSELTQEPDQEQKLPPALDTADFRAAWGEWTAYRRETRKPLTAATVNRQLASLAKMGHAGAIASIDQSIEHGWAGLFPVKTNGRPAGQRIGPGQRHPSQQDRF